MKPLMTLCWAVLLLTLGATLFAQPIYRVVDEHGNVIYTDQKPGDDAEPITLPELDVVGARDETITDIVTEEDPEASAPGLELAIVEPSDGATLPAGPAGQFDLRIESNFEIPPAAEIVVFIDDIPQEPIRQLSTSLAGLPAGSYRLRAELQTPEGRVLTASEEIRVTLIEADRSESGP